MRFGCLPGKTGVRRQRKQRPGGPIDFGTTVPLTRTGPTPILLGIEHCPTYQVGESLSKRWDGRVCINTEQAHGLSYLTLV